MHARVVKTDKKASGVFLMIPSVAQRPLVRARVLKVEREGVGANSPRSSRAVKTAVPC